MKLFISYRSLDSVKVDAIVARLKSIKTINNTNTYTVWQDKKDILVGQDWWQAIVDAIIACDVFIFMISRESLKSDICKAELSYAIRRNRPIIPLVLEEEFLYNATTGKNEIDYWSDIPEELSNLRTQFLFYEGASFAQSIEIAVKSFASESQRWRDFPADRPIDPRTSLNEANDTISIYAQACDYAGKLEFSFAERLFQKLVNWDDPDFSEVALEWISILREYQKIILCASRDNTRYKVYDLWKEYHQKFPKKFTNLFDPKDFQTQVGNGELSSLKEQQAKVEQARPDTTEYIPLPFPPTVTRPSRNTPIITWPSRILPPSSQQSLAQNKLPYLHYNIRFRKITLLIVILIVVSLFSIFIFSLVASVFSKRQLIAFSSYRDGNNDIYVIDTDGNNERKLIENEAWDDYPVWSPDGQSIAFFSTRDDWGVYIMSLSTNEVNRLVKARSYSGGLAWSSDGKKIAFVSEYNDYSDIYVVNSDGTNLYALTANSAYDVSPSWSPDGQQIVFASNRDTNYNLYIIDIETKFVRRLTQGSEDYSSPVWSPDGRNIAYFVNSNNGRLCVMDTNGNNKNCILDGFLSGIEPSWSPDSHQIVFTSIVDENKEIFIVDVDGSSLKRLTYNSSDDNSPNWQPIAR